ncbi:MAG: PhzF family phenazine biosynthesis protein [Actinomycetota bacterium]
MRHCDVLSVFTRDGTGGNALGVVTDVAGLDGAAMQAIAAELGFSETVFLDWTVPGVPQARIFTPAAEMPFAGHPLVGAGWVLGAMGPGTTRRVACGIGEIPFRFEGDRVFIEVPVPRDVESVVAAPVPAGLPEAQRAWLVRLPLRYLLLEVGAPEVVAGAHPDFGALADAPWEGTLLFARSGEAVKARFFAPAVGVPEDPATGSAAVALAAALSHAGEAAGALVVEQGDEVGAPSRLEVVWGGGIVAVGGTVRRDEVRVLAR